MSAYTEDELFDEALGQTNSLTSSLEEYDGHDDDDATTAGLLHLFLSFCLALRLFVALIAFSSAASSSSSSMTMSTTPVLLTAMSLILNPPPYKPPLDIALLFELIRSCSSTPSPRGDHFHDDHDLLLFVLLVLSCCAD